MIDYTLILIKNYDGEQWSLNGDSYDGLEWFSETPKPTQEELDALWPSTEETQAKDACKSQATTILNATDWTSIADVGDSTKANPYLINQAEFIAYRSTVRGYAVNPVVDPVFPTAPTEQWSS
jgi:hypothetical protein